MITGMIRPSSGKIIFGDEDITKSPMYKRARMGIGYLAQEPSIFGKLSVEDNLKIVLETIIPNKEEQITLENVRTSLPVMIPEQELTERVLEPGSSPSQLEEITIPDISSKPVFSLDDVLQLSLIHI